MLEFSIINENNVFFSAIYRGERNEQVIELQQVIYNYSMNLKKYHQSYMKNQVFSQFASSKTQSSDSSAQLLQF
jgi:hypothetical protein